MKLNSSNITILIHSFVAIILSLVIYYFNQELAKAVFAGSLVFNIYLRMLCFSFDKLNTNTGSPRRTLRVLLAMTTGTSALRTAIIAAILAILIMKFKLNLIGLGIAFVLYQVIFIGVGIYINASHNRRTFRQGS